MKVSTLITRAWHHEANIIALATNIYVQREITRSLAAQCLATSSTRLTASSDVSTRLLEPRGPCPAGNMNMLCMRQAGVEEKLTASLPLRLLACVIRLERLR